jgi:enoyl-[acyl-carrier protein] reductase II
MNSISELLGIQYPIIQAGMIWCSGWELASACSNHGALGIIGAGSMYPEVLDTHIKKCTAATDKPFGVNLPLLYPDIEAHIETIIKHKVPVVITSAGSPKKYTQRLKDEGIKVIHVVSSALFAKKSEDAGVDAVVCEGFEAGGHNGREETTTFCLIPDVRAAVKIPVIAAGGIGSGQAMFAAMSLGADGVQIGSRFVASEESSAHIHFKQKVVDAKAGDTELTLKELTPVRLMKNPFYESIQDAYVKKASQTELLELLGRGRAKKGMFLGDLNEGELEIGQVSATINEIMPAGQIIRELVQDYNKTRIAMSAMELKEV